MLAPLIIELLMAALLLLLVAWVSDVIHACTNRTASVRVAGRKCVNSGG